MRPDGSASWKEERSLFRTDYQWKEVSNLIRVLVVEDDICLQTVIKQLFKNIDKNIQVHWATTAEEALLMIESQFVLFSHHYEMIIADIGLPGESSGIDLWVKCKAQYPKLAFMLTSGMPIDEFIRKIAGYENCPPCLPKPFRTLECKQMILGMLKGL